MTLKVVLNEDGEVAPPPHYTIPSAHWLLLDQVRLGYWAAVISGRPTRIAKALRAWQDVLHVPKTRVTNGT